MSDEFPLVKTTAYLVSQGHDNENVKMGRKKWNRSENATCGKTSSTEDEKSWDVFLLLDDEDGDGDGVLYAPWIKSDIN